MSKPQVNQPAKNDLSLLNSVLDLDHMETWDKGFERLICKSDVWKVLAVDFANSCALFDELDFGPDHVRTGLVRQLRSSANNILRMCYSHVAAYHACRPRTTESYLRQGLLPTNRRLLQRESEEVFGDLPGFSQKFDIIVTQYLTWYDGILGLFLSGADMIAQPTSWLYGSCFLQKMADAFGTDGKERLDLLQKETQPIMIRCILPVAWLDEFTREPSLWQYASALLKKTFLFKKCGAEAIHYNSGAIGLRKAVPPEWIDQIIDVNVDAKETR